MDNMGSYLKHTNPFFGEHIISDFFAINKYNFIKLYPFKTSKISLSFKLHVYVIQKLNIAKKIKHNISILIIKTFFLNLPRCYIFCSF
jgi:hypothetical protein